jgi:hypothetical protein
MVRNVCWALDLDERFPFNANSLTCGLRAPRLPSSIAKSIAWLLLIRGTT